MRNIHIIPKQENIERYVELSDTCGIKFEYNDFFIPDVLDSDALCREKIAFYKSLGRDMSQDTLHGAFFDVTVFSSDKLIREVSEKRLEKSIEIAAELGCKGMVMHTNFMPNFLNEEYSNVWLERNEVFIRKMLERYKNECIYMENMFDTDYTMLKKLALRLQDEDRFGICLDYAHASLGKIRTVEWIEQLYPYIKHMHINDNHFISDEHAPLGRGKIDWKEFFFKLYELKLDASMLIEVRSYDAFAESMKYIEDNGFMEIFSKKTLK